MYRSTESGATGRRRPPVLVKGFKTLCPTRSVHCGNVLFIKVLRIRVGIKSFKNELPKSYFEFQDVRISVDHCSCVYVTT